mgnify:CR=1 FL=1
MARWPTRRLRPDGQPHNHPAIIVIRGAPFHLCAAQGGTDHGFQAIHRMPICRDAGTRRAALCAKHRRNTRDTADFPAHSREARSQLFASRDHDFRPLPLAARPVLSDDRRRGRARHRSGVDQRGSRSGWRRRRPRGHLRGQGSRPIGAHQFTWTRRATQPPLPSSPRSWRVVPYGQHHVRFARSRPLCMRHGVRSAQRA